MRLYTSLGDWNFEWNISGQLGWLKQIGKITTGPIVRFFLKILKISISWVCNERKTFHHLSISTWRRWKKNGLRGPFPPASLARTGRWLSSRLMQQSCKCTRMRPSNVKIWQNYSQAFLRKGFSSVCPRWVLKKPMFISVSLTRQLVI